MQARMHVSIVMCSFNLDEFCLVPERLSARRDVYTSARVQTPVATEGHQPATCKSTAHRVGQARHVHSTRKHAGMQDANTAVRLSPEQSKRFLGFLICSEREPCMHACVSVLRAMHACMCLGTCL